MTLALDSPPIGRRPKSGFAKLFGQRQHLQVFPPSFLEIATHHLQFRQPQPRPSRHMLIVPGPGSVVRGVEMAASFIGTPHQQRRIT